MSFSQTAIADVTIALDGPELYVAWSTLAPWGTLFQVYVDRRLTWCGRQNFCTCPVPGNARGRNIWVEVGAVGASELRQDFSDQVVGPGGLNDRARLSWYGGTYLDQAAHDDIMGYFVYQSPSAGSPVQLTTPVASVPAYPNQVITDGYGLGEFGRGSFGRAASLYNWVSPPLAPGAWQFAVAPYDAAGNVQSAPQAVTVIIASAPRPPALNEAKARLTYSYSGPGSATSTLTWLPSPSESG